MTDRPSFAALARVAEALSGELGLEEILAQVVASAREITGARYAALGVLGERGELTRFIHVGMPEERAERIGPLPRGHGILGLLTRQPSTVRLDDLTDHPDAYGFPADHPPMHTFLGTPIRSGGKIFGNLYLTEKPGGFTEDDERLVEVCAAQAGAAIENALLSERLQDLAVQDERDRISRDLHDGIIQTLFSIGMGLESARALLPTAPDRVASRLDDAVDAIDGAIRSLRSTIFRLRPNEAASLGLRQGIIELAREHEINALVRPDLDLPADLDLHVPDALVPDALQIVREALSNVARHAGGAAVRVTASVRDRRLRLQVRDTGKGFDPTAAGAGHGLENMRERAALHGAGVHVDSEPGHGADVQVDFDLDSGRDAADEQGRTGP